MDINVKGVWLSLKHEIPAMLKNGGGAIVNTSSGLGLVGAAGVPIYVASAFSRDLFCKRFQQWTTKILTYSGF
jgi:NADP-dependent 3-hydroxy acid dehydrogenase YdfG